MWLFSILLILVLFVPPALYFWFRRAGRLIRKIPGPISLPIIGNLLIYFRTPDNLFRYHRTMPKLYGDVNQVHAMNTRMVNLSHPDDIEKILSASQGNLKKHPYSYLDYWLGEGLLVSNGSKWAQRRKMLTKAFHFNILQNFFVTFNEEADLFLERVQEETGKYRTDLFPLMSSTALNVMCATAMGSTNEEQKQSISNKFFSCLEVIGECFIKRATSPWLQTDFIFQLTKIAKKQKIAAKKLHTITSNVIKNRRDYLAARNFNHFEHDDNYESNEKLALLDLLLKNEKAGVIDHQGVREEVDSFMFAGHDTTATALTLIIMALANELEIQEKIFEEIYEVLGDTNRSPTIKDLNQMKYLECCIKESMRLYPSVPAIARTLVEETVIGGYTVPANTTAVIFIYDLHRRPDLFPEPERFIPERFLPENCAKRHQYAYIPFSAGPRNCIGQKFAMLEMKTMMCKLLRKYRLEPVTRPKDIVFKADIVTRVVHPIYVKFRPR